jgi:mlo protein
MSGNALHQTHVLIFLIAIFHVIYSLIMIRIARRKVKSFDRYEAYGTHESHSVEGRGFRPPHKGWLAAFANQLNWVSPLISKHSNYPIKPFTYMSVRNFFIIKHRLAPNFPFDDYCLICVVTSVADIMGITSWMWLVVIVRVILDSLSPLSYGLLLTFFSVFLSLAVGTKVSKIVRDIAIESYELYDTNKDGMLSHEEVLQMQSVHAEEPEHAALGDEELLQQTPTGSQLFRSRSTAHSTLTDSNFWFGKPKLLLGMLQFIMFDNATCFAFAVFEAWQLAASAHDGGFHTDCRSLWLVLLRLALAFVALLHGGLVLIPLYTVAVQTGATCNKNIMQKVQKLIALGSIQLHGAISVERGESFRSAPIGLDLDGDGNVDHYDLTGDGHANAASVIGFDTTGDGRIDSFDTTGDGRIDTELGKTAAPPPSPTLPKIGEVSEAEQPKPAGE